MSRIHGASRLLNPAVVGMAADGVTLCVTYPDPVFDVTALGSPYQFSAYRGAPSAWLDHVPATLDEVRVLLESGRMYGSFHVNYSYDTTVRLDHVELTVDEVDAIAGGADYRAILFGGKEPLQVVLHGD